MIFGMTGMHTSGFDRLVRALDGYALEHPDRDVLIQAGSSKYRPRKAGAFAYKADLREEIDAADIVVSQGSIGFLDALRLGKRLVVVPRLERFGEAIDDHQVAFSRSFSARYGFPVVMEISDLGRAIDQAATGPAPRAILFESASPLHGELAAYLAGLASR